MQAPTLIFDHINKVVMTTQSGPVQDEKVAEILAAQRDQVTTSGSTPPRAA